MTTQTLAALRAALRIALASTAAWPDASLNSFIADAIRLYSATFKRTWKYTLALTTGTQAYPLPGGHAIDAVLSVEYPTSESPRSFLKPALEQSAEFDNAEDVYAIRPIADTTLITADTAAAQIVFAETVATGESAVITYTGEHPTPTADTHYITVPPEHWEAINAYVEWRCFTELANDEGPNITNTTLTLAQLSDTTRRLWNRYKEVMNAIRASAAGQSEPVSWYDASGGRIY